MNTFLNWGGSKLVVLFVGAVLALGCSPRKRVKTEVLISSVDAKTSLHAVSILEDALEMKGIAYTGDSAGGILSVEFEGSISDLGLESTISALDISCDVKVKEIYVR